MMLDINTPRGQETLKQEQRAAEMLKKELGYSYIDTRKDLPAKIDAIITKSDVVKAVALTACRKFTHDELRLNYRNEWLITYDKIVTAQQIAVAMCCECWGIVYMIPEDAVLAVKIYTTDGWVPFRVERTLTQATCNGGEAIRDNAFIDMRNARLIRSQ